jgi:hypothetical protein
MCIRVTSLIWIRIKVAKIQERKLTLEAWRLKKEPWRVCRPVVADSYHFVEEQDADLH